MTCGSNLEMNRYVNVGIELNTTVESLQKHLCNSDNSRDASNENGREKLMRVKRSSYLSMHCHTRTLAQTWAALEACPSKLPCNPLHCFPIVLALVQLAPHVAMAFLASQSPSSKGACEQDPSS
jgi:hypothetical protein